VAARRPRRIKGDNNIAVPPSRRRRRRRHRRRRRRRRRRHRRRRRRRRPAIITPKVDEFPRPAWNSRGNTGSRPPGVQHPVR